MTIEPPPPDTCPQLGTVPCILWWLGGYDFNERGFVAVTLGIMTLLFFVAPLTFPE